MPLSIHRPASIDRPASIAITGASSGIGAALARHYAGPGVRLGLIGRNADRLAGVAAAAAARGAEVRTGVLDVRDGPGLTAFLKDLDAEHPVDLLIAAAGVLDGSRKAGEPETAAIARAVIETNLLGALDTVHALLPGFLARRHGQVGLIASLAAYSPLPDAPAYGASKAALLSYGLALRASLAGSGVTVSVACPGYVTTRMTAQHLGHRPGEMDAHEAARRIALGLASGQETIVFPAGLGLVSRLSALAPERVRRWGMAGLRFQVGKAPGD